MAVAISQTANPVSAGTGTTITYSGVSIGVAAADRVVAVAVSTELTAGAISSATIDFGGGAVAMLSSANGAQGAVGARMFWLSVPTGTTADIAITFAASQTANTQHITVYRAVGASETASGSGGIGDTDADPISSGAITIPTGGGCIAVCAMAATGVRTWAGITEGVDEGAGATPQYQHTTGTSTTAGTPTITVSGGNNEDGALAWLILKPGTQLAMDAGSYAITGQDVTLVKPLSLAIDAGSYGLTGQAVILSLSDWAGYGAVPYAAAPYAGPKLTDPAGPETLSITVDAGSYAVTGQDVALAHGWVVAVDGSSYSVSGQDVTLVHSWAVPVDAGSYAVTGQDVSLTKTWLLNVDSGSYAVTGQDVALSVGFAVAVDAGSYSITGQDVTLSVGFAVAVDAGSYSVTGQDVTLAHDWAIPIDAGSYAVTGQDVTLTKAGALIGVDAGSYAITGQDVALAHQWLMDVESGGYLLTGQDVELTKTTVATAGGYSDPGFWTEEHRKIKEREEGVPEPIEALSNLPEFIVSETWGDADEEDEFSELMELMEIMDHASI
jgi:hypothetical protein